MSITVRSPYDGTVLGEVPECSPDDVDKAVQVAKDALAAEPLPAGRRAEIHATPAPSRPSPSRRPASRPSER